MALYENLPRFGSAELYNAVIRLLTVVSFMLEVLKFEILTVHKWFIMDTAAIVSWFYVVLSGFTY